MAKLDDLFRRSHEHIRPATPPPGQWARIQAGVPTTRVRTRHWSFLPGLLLGLLLGGGLTMSLAPFGTESPTPVIPDCPVVGPSVLTSSVPSVPPDTVFVTVYRDRPASLVAVGTSPLKSVMPPPLIASPKEKPIQLLPEISLRAATVTHPVPDYEFERLRSWNTERELQQAMIQNTDIVMVEVDKFRKQKPAGRWEVGLHVTASLPARKTTADLFTDATSSSPGQDPVLLEDGRELFLDQLGRGETEQEKEVFAHVLSLDVARQFSSGLRVGLGLTGIADKQGFVSSYDGLAVEFGDADFARTSDFWKVNLFATLAVGYTFRRDRKLQYYVGGLLMGKVSVHGEARKVYYDFARRQAFIGDIDKFGIDGSFDDFYLLPQFGIHHRLGKRFTLGIEISPGFSAGARYQF